ncbi:MAG: divergent PAP2 family protein [Clostridiales bacterium]|nr:divergent PAP2 family protein [Clostridiales bacterium]
MAFYEYIKILLPAGLAWVAAQVVKFIIAAFKKGDKDILASGGMPSTHTAVVISLTTRIAYLEGFGTPVFSACAIFAIVVMFDAINVRYVAGELTKKYNAMAKFVYKDDPEKAEKEQMKVINGHTLAEVVAGVAVGVFVGLVYSFIEGAILK